MRNIDRLKQMNARELAQFLKDNNSCADCMKCCIEYGDDCDGLDCVDGIEQWLETEVNPMPTFRAGMVICYIDKDDSYRDAVMIDDRWAFDFRAGVIDAIMLRKNTNVIIRKVCACVDGQLIVVWEAD